MALHFHFCIRWITGKFSTPCSSVFSRHGLSPSVRYGGVWGVWLKKQYKWEGTAVWPAAVSPTLWQQWLKAWAQSASCKLWLQRWQMLGHTQFISIYDFLLLKEKMRIIVTDGCYKTYYHKLGSKYNRVYKLTASCKVRNPLVLDWIYNITLLRACNVFQPYNFSLSNQGHQVWSSVLKTNKG